jgi:hypothetical protein
MEARGAAARHDEKIGTGGVENGRRAEHRVTQTRERNRTEPVRRGGGKRDQISLRSDGRGENGFIRKSRAPASMARRR